MDYELLDKYIDSFKSICIWIVRGELDCHLICAQAFFHNCYLGHACIPIWFLVNSLWAIPDLWTLCNPHTTLPTVSVPSTFIREALSPQGASTKKNLVLGGELSSLHKQSKALTKVLSSSAFCSLWQPHKDTTPRHHFGSRLWTCSTLLDMPSSRTVKNVFLLSTDYLISDISRHGGRLTSSQRHAAQQSSDWDGDRAMCLSSVKHNTEFCFLLWGTMWAHSQKDTCRLE